MAAFNFEVDSINWFKSYLTDRSQAVQVQSKRSPLKQLDSHGVPQGSVLGGLLYIIFENDFPGCRGQGESIMFVDDDTDCISDSNPVDLVTSMQLEADKSCNWLKDNRM